MDGRKVANLWQCLLTQRKPVVIAQKESLFLESPTQTNVFLLFTECAAEALPPAWVLSVVGRCSNGRVGGKWQNNAFASVIIFFFNSRQLGFLNDLWMYQICFSVSTVIPAFVLHYLFIEVQYCAKVLLRCVTHSPAFEPICLVFFALQLIIMCHLTLNMHSYVLMTLNLKSGDGDLSAAAHCLNEDHRVKKLSSVLISVHTKLHCCWQSAHGLKQRLFECWNDQLKVYSLKNTSHNISFWWNKASEAFEGTTLMLKKIIFSIIYSLNVNFAATLLSVCPRATLATFIAHHHRA